MTKDRKKFKMQPFPLQQMENFQHCCVWIRIPSVKNHGSGLSERLDPDPVNIRPDPKPWISIIKNLKSTVFDLKLVLVWLKQEATRQKSQGLLRLNAKHTKI